PRCLSSCVSNWTPSSSCTSRTAVVTPSSLDSGFPPGNMNASVSRFRTSATRPSSLNKTTAETLMDWLWGTITHFPIQGDHRQYDGGTNVAEHQVQPEVLPDGQQGAVIGLIRPQC